MKKQLIAAAVAAALAAPAMAQNVSIGGNFDVSYDFSKNNTSDALKTDGLLSTPALNVGVTEDLGGGMKAFANVNSRWGHTMGVQGSAGSTQAASGKVADRTGAINFGDRGSQVGLSGAFGEIAVGKTTGTGLGGIRGGVNGNLSLLSESSWGDRPDSMVSYTTPVVNGLSLRIVYQTTTNSMEVSGKYSAGPLSVAVAANDVKAVSAVTGVYGTAGVSAVNAGKDQGMRVTYKAGPATINASVIKYETASTDSTEKMIGVSYPLTGALTIGVDSGEVANVTKTNASLVYTLSKRTNVYAAAQKKGDTADTTTAVGIRHSF